MNLKRLNVLRMIVAIFLSQHFPCFIPKEVETRHHSFGMEKLIIARSIVSEKKTFTIKQKLVVRLQILEHFCKSSTKLIIETIWQTCFVKNRKGKAAKIIGEICPPYFGS